MKNDKLVPGLILVLIGAAILLANFGFLQFHWYNIFRLWPIFLVIGGVNLVFAHNKSPWAAILKISVVILGFGIILFGNFGDGRPFWWGNNWGNHISYNTDKDDDNDNDDVSGSLINPVSGVFNEPYEAAAKHAKLNITGGATAYELHSTTDQLFSASAGNMAGRFLLGKEMDDSTYVVNFGMKKHGGFNFDSDKNNKTELSLNTNPIWEIDVETGASSLNFDLSPYKVSDLHLEGGATSLHVKMGMPVTGTTNIEVETGFADVQIDIPQNAACQIETDSGLSGNEFDSSFKKTDDNNYETDGYNNAQNKIHIHIDGGLSDFKVKRY